MMSRKDIKSQSPVCMVEVHGGGDVIQQGCSLRSIETPGGNLHRSSLSRRWLRICSGGYGGVVQMVANKSNFAARRIPSYYY